MTIPDSLTCTRCGQSKPLDCFARRTSGRHGREFACKDCTNAQAARRRASKRAEARAAAASIPDNAKRCGRCGMVKHVDLFYRCAAKGRQSYCKTCLRIAMAEWREANQQRLREIRRAWLAIPDNAARNRETVRLWASRHHERGNAASLAYGQSPRGKTMRAIRNCRRRLAALSDPREIARLEALIARLQSDLARLPTPAQQRAKMLEEAR